MSKIELVIFDCDGVVIDSEILSAAVLIDMLGELSIEIDRAYVQKHFLGCSFKTVSQKILNNFNTTLPSGFEDDYRHALVKQFTTKLTATDGIDSIIPQLAVPFCIATSSSLARTTKALETVELLSYFTSNIFTSEEVVNGKPAPDLFLHAAKNMGVAAQNCLVIEDSEAGINAAMSAGMQVLHYSGGQHLKGKINHVSEKYNDVANLSSWQHFFTQFPSLTLAAKSS